MKRERKRRIGGTPLVAIALVCCLLGCQRDAGTYRELPAENPVGAGAARSSRPDSIGLLVTGVQIDEKSAFPMRGGPSYPGGGPRLGEPEILSRPIPGGSSRVRLSSETPFSTVIVMVGGLTDYFELPLGGETTHAEPLLLFSQDLPPRFTMFFSAVDANGERGPDARREVEPLVVGTGDIQVSLSWTTPTDVDLHLVEPDGNEIFYSQRQSGSGGVLDLDSNAGCRLDHTNAENITWPSAPARPGKYIVRVDYYENCEVARTTSYTVAVHLKGKRPKVFTGTFGPRDADQGKAGSGKVVTEFSVP